MTMDISNQNKLSEFYEELKRLNVDVVRPDINECFADFRTIDNKFYYALGGIKAVGYEAISNICLLYTSPSPRDRSLSRMPSSA